MCMTKEERKIYNRNYFKEYRKTKKYKDYQKDYQQDYHQDRKTTDEYKDYQKKYAKGSKKKTYLKSYQKEYNKTEKRKNYIKNKRQTDPLFKLTTNIKTRISRSFREGGYTKRSRTYIILGCNFDDLKKHLESQWESWMSWDNYGKYDGYYNTGWDIDHIIPTSSAKTEEELLNLNHYTNLQPLCSYINRNEKRNTI